MSKDKAIERIDFEEKWLSDLLIKDELQNVDIVNTFYAIRRMVEQIEE